MKGKAKLYNQNLWNFQKYHFLDIVVLLHYQKNK
jgi:hypothetical protein